MHKYKNISGHEQAIIGIGLVPADAVFTLDAKIHNPNFVEIADGERQTSEVLQPTVDTVKENE